MQQIQRDQMDKFYLDTVKEVGPKDPVALAKPVRMTCLVYAGYTGDKLTRQSYSGVILLIK